MPGPLDAPQQPVVAVLLGGGVESTSLVRRYLDEGAHVVPVHVQCGLIWDACEADHVARFCSAQKSPRLSSLVSIRVALADYLQGHWSITGRGVPRGGESAAHLEIPLRNLFLLSLAARRLEHVPHFALALGTTADNHYRDGSREYFDRCEDVLSIELGRRLRILTPLIGQSKLDVIRATPREVLALSFSCVDPQRGEHCGRCIKCARRGQAFRDAGIDDPTTYASTTRLASMTVNEPSEAQPEAA